MEDSGPLQRGARRAYAEENVFRSYNYVGARETVAYLFNDWSNAFNINVSPPDVGRRSCGPFS